MTRALGGGLRALAAAALTVVIGLASAPSGRAQAHGRTPEPVTHRCAARPNVTVGGVTGFASLGDPAATDRLRASCRVGLYIHAEGWKVLDDATRAKILGAFQGSGPAVVELGYASTPKSYFRDFYKPAFVDRGVKADTALINGLCHDGTAGALAFIAAAKSYGLEKVAVVFAPNSGQFKTSRFSDPQWDCVRVAGRAGGAIAVDAPPHVFFALGNSYQDFVMDEVRWAKQNGVESVLIVSPNGSGPLFAREAGQLLARFAQGDATPSNFVFETYDIQRHDAANQVGRESDPLTVTGVALRLLPNLAH